MDIAIIGGGATGFFAAIATKENYPDAYRVKQCAKMNLCPVAE